MARVIGSPGYGATIEGVFAYAEPVVVGLFMLPFLSAAIVFGPHDLRVVIGVGGGLLIGGVLNAKGIAQTFKNVHGGRHWLKGAVGEKRVAQELAKLPEEYVVFHDFSWRDSDGNRAEWNIDHIVLGPNGVFVIETKNYARRVVRSAQDDQYTRKAVGQVERNARQFKDKLKLWSRGDLSSVFVEALLVYAQDGAWVDKTRERYTRVVPASRVTIEILGRNKQDVSREQAYAIARVLWNQLSPAERLEFESVWDEVRADSKAVQTERLRLADARREALASVPTVCPHCGAPLVERTAKFGERKGKRFLGCSQFAKCGKRFVHNLDDDAA